MNDASAVSDHKRIYVFHFFHVGASQHSTLADAPRHSPDVMYG